MIESSRSKPAFQCGALFAILEIIQRRALGDTSTSVTDRFFGSASINPALIFPLLLRTAQAHLRKLRRDHVKAFHALSREVEQILGALKEFPTCLSIEDQGLFALGFYQYKAARRFAWKRSQTQPDSKDQENPGDVAGKRFPKGEVAV
jgi:CRISPR-associated protein Csd1